MSAASNRLHSDLADLAEQVTVVDLQARVLRSSRQLGTRRAVTAVAAAIVLLGGGAGTAAAVLPDRPAPLPPTAVVTTAPPSRSPSPTPSTSPPSSPTQSTTTSPSAHGAAPPANIISDLYLQTSNKLLHYSSGDNGNPGGWQVQATVYQPGPRTYASPDRTKLAWWSESGKLMVSSLHGDNPKTIVSTDAVVCEDLHWTADSQQLLFATSTAQRLVTTEFIRPDGSGRHAIPTASPNDSCDPPLPSADGRILVGAQNSDPLQAFVEHSDGTGRRVLPLKLPKGWEYGGELAVSAHGSLALIVAFPTAGCGCDPAGRYFVLNLATSGVTELHRTDGHRLTAAFDNAGHIVVVDDAAADPDPRSGTGTPRVTVYSEHGSVLDTLPPPTGAEEIGWQIVSAS